MIVMIVAPLNIDVCMEHSCTPIICDVYTNYLRGYSHDEQ